MKACLQGSDHLAFGLASGFLIPGRQQTSSSCPIGILQKRFLMVRKFFDDSCTDFLNHMMFAVNSSTPAARGRELAPTGSGCRVYRVFHQVGPKTVSPK